MRGVRWRVTLCGSLLTAATLLGNMLPVLGSQPVTQVRSSRSVRRAVIVSVDGLRPDLLLSGHAPRMRQLLARSTYTMRARTVTEGYTVPSHVSMLTGVVPDRHGVTWDHHIEDAYPAVPTIFELARQAGFTTAAVVGKTKLIVLTKPGTLDWSYVGDEDRTTDMDTARRAASIVRAHRPDLLFVHLGQFDVAGHRDGWGSPEQRRALARADDAFGVIEDALAAAGVLDSTVEVLTADHGGDGLLHDPDNPLSQRIPWIVAGPGIRRGYDLEKGAASASVTTMSTFATVCSLLGITARQPIDGRVVTEILSPPR